MDDVKAKLDQEETNKVDQSEQEKVNNTEEHNAAAEVTSIAEAGGQKDGVNDDDDVTGDVWELEDISEMQMATELFGGHYNVRGGWGEWKHDGGETWREWEFYPTYQENDWVIDDLWVFDQGQYHHPNQTNSGDAANPRNPKA